MSKVLKTVLKVAAVVATFFIPGVGGIIAKAVLTAAVSIGVSRLISTRADTPADAGNTDTGGRIQLPPATTNKIPIVYGSAFVGGPIIDAMLSTDQKTMWYVVALAENSDDQGGGGGGYTFDTNKIYYDGKLVQFGSNGAVTGLYTNNAPPSDPAAQIDTRCNGFLYIYLFTNGSSSGVNTGGLTADQILSVANGVPSNHAWNGTQAMTNCAFAIVKVLYSTDAGTTGIGTLTTHITNSLTKPGECILDYMLNERYGCAIPKERIDLASLTALDTYSDELIDYIPADGNTTPPLPQQARYRLNGPINTSESCLNNLQYMVDSCDSWLQYSELTGLWKVVINQKYSDNPSTPTINDLFLVNSSNLVGGIDISPLDLNETFNQIEVAYPNTNIKDQTDYQIIDLFEDDPQILSQNEAVNRLNITLPLVNNAVQAKYLASRRIYQSREDLVIEFKLDYNGIQLEAGDVVRVEHEVYGWYAPGKLFRVSTVSEQKDVDGNLYVVCQAFEYNNDIYDDVIQDFIPAFNTGLKDPNVISQPGTPTITTTTAANGQITSFDVTSYVPDSGLVLYMDFNYGNNSNVLEHRLYRTIQQSNGAPYINSDTANSVYTNVSVSINDLPTGDYYFSVTARNNTAGKRSNSSAVFSWFGANIANNIVWNPCNASSNGNTITSDTIANFSVGGNVILLSGNGTLANNTYVTGIISSNTFTVTPTPTVALSNACLQIQSGGVRGNQVQSNAIGYVNISNSVVALTPILQLGFVIAKPDGNVTLPVDLANLASFANVDVPCYLIGNTLSNSYYNPYAQNTATTANGFYANSTAPYQPGNAAFLAITQGEDNWYLYTGGTYSNAVLDSIEYAETTVSTQITTDEPTTLQFMQVAIVSISNVYYHLSDTQVWASMDLPLPNTPYIFQHTFKTTPTGSDSLAGGVMIRNLNGNANIVLSSHDITVNKGKV